MKRLNPNTPKRNEGSHTSLAEGGSELAANGWAAATGGAAVAGWEDRGSASKENMSKSDPNCEVAAAAGAADAGLEATGVGVDEVAGVKSRSASCPSSPENVSREGATSIWPNPVSTIKVCACAGVVDLTGDGTFATSAWLKREENPPAPVETDTLGFSEALTPKMFIREASICVVFQANDWSWVWA